jgi:hypothetical protein
MAKQWNLANYFSQAFGVALNGYLNIAIFYFGFFASQK